MERDDERSREPSQHMEIQPILGTALAREPSPALSEGIEKDRAKQQQSEFAQFEADGPAWLQDSVFGRERTVSGVEGVVVEAVYHKYQDQRDRKHVSDQQRPAMRPLRFDGRQNGSSNGRVHCLIDLSDALLRTDGGSVSNR